MSKSDSLAGVSAAANQPPPDIDALEARLAAALAERDTPINERDAALRQNDRLAHLLRQLQRMQFGRRSEKLDPDQFALALEDIEQVVAAREAADDKQNKAAAAARVEKRRARRGALPAHLPRVHLTIEPEDWNCPCCRSPMHAIGADVSERLDVVPAQFRVLVTHRPKYACRACEEAVVQAPAPERLIKGGLPTEAMAASVLVSKYAWRLSSGPDAGCSGARHQALDAGVLGRLRGRGAQAGLRPPSRTHPDLGQDRGRRDEGAGARSGPRSGQGRLFLGGRPRRSAVERIGPSGDRLRLGARPRSDPWPEAARRLSGRRPGRRLRRRQDTRRQDTRRPDHARLLLVAPATSVLRSRQGRSADRPPGAGADRRALRDREDDPRHRRRGASSRAPGEAQAARHGVQTVAP